MKSFKKIQRLQKKVVVLIQKKTKMLKPKVHFAIESQINELYELLKNTNPDKAKIFNIEQELAKNPKKLHNESF